MALDAVDHTCANAPVAQDHRRVAFHSSRTDVRFRPRAAAWRPLTNRACSSSTSSSSSNLPEAMRLVSSVRNQLAHRHRVVASRYSPCEHVLSCTNCFANRAQVTISTKSCASCDSVARTHRCAHRVSAAMRSLRSAASTSRGRRQCTLPAALAHPASVDLRRDTLRSGDAVSPPPPTRRHSSYHSQPRRAHSNRSDVPSAHPS